ncbi:MAG: hypothetical protein M3Z16_04235, partial [Pseudomonadota bacterium]|nr:hypothetical protein [Pseudomonadota bacterium]
MRSAFNFRATTGPTLLELVLLGAALLALMGVLIARERIGSERTGLETELQAKRELEAERRRPVPALPPSAAELRLRAAAAELRRPWLQTFRTVEKLAQDPVYLRTLVFEPASGSLKIEAE